MIATNMVSGTSSSSSSVVTVALGRQELELISCSTPWITSTLCLDNIGNQAPQNCIIQ